MKRETLYLLAAVFLAASVGAGVGFLYPLILPPPSQSVEETYASTVEFEGLKRDVSNLYDRISELEKEIETNPDFFIRRMDRDLDLLEKGQNPHGSFSDYFVPNAMAALKAGAAKKEVLTRLERVVALAEKKVYLSSYVGQLVREGGIEAVRSYIEGATGLRLSRP